ncbi:cbb3-type cytochrome oxidase assembly protein CcoS [Pleomorphomonas diazotrophica]|uniref:Cbb3-type cytochrome oxidase assembly protein CcoS n=1 Tax=Pleomorphomonas diazotrophica TaxID=1166257 RepID=A0A1I4TG28_9HYPH|nr:cbb3-type cytochrome oxidase assembly protein CcoS [Pleomorphomonas diazotrophica]PKR87229.1 cbb3-type cytochrome oxidase assembly protein CcoS [Pleomorphomonas diazotrophica]SFM75583.1 cytochrome oxidase maturation protein, cbb3-type [Pleomorphomonas diazotrophica]
MSVLVFLVPVALLLGLLGLAGFMWSLKTGQYEDLEGAAWRILEDDDIEDKPEADSEGVRGRVPEGEERRRG